MLDSIAVFVIFGWLLQILNLRQVGLSRKSQWKAESQKGRMKSVSRMLEAGIAYAGRLADRSPSLNWRTHKNISASSAIFTQASSFISSSQLMCWIVTQYLQLKWDGRNYSNSREDCVSITLKRHEQWTCGERAWWKDYKSTQNMRLGKNWFEIQGFFL